MAPIARIDLGALQRNAERLLEAVQPRGLLAVVKWNGYGHGLADCARVLDRAGAAGFGVSSPQEGIELRKLGISQPILVMTDWVGKPLHDFLDWDLEAAATSWYKVEYLAAASRKLGRPIPAHVKFDTGLGRVGLPHSDSRHLLERIAGMSDLRVVGLYSHLAYNGPRDRERGSLQIERFNRIVSEAREVGLTPRWVHLANSAAALAMPEVPGDLVRTGIALYGQPPSAEVAKLHSFEPVMSLTGHVRSIRRLRRGFGYPAGMLWKAPREGWGAEIDLGYSAGFPRSLAGRCSVLWRGNRVPLVGAVGGEASYVFTGSEPATIGEEVVFWGRQGSETIYLYELADLIGCLPYELTTWLAPDLERSFTADRNQ